jgi:hypothetical protein
MSTYSGFTSSSRDGAMGSRAMPQMGQIPGPSVTISGSMGQVYFTATPSGTSRGCTVTGASELVRFGMYFSGSRLNFSRHFELQK